MDFKLKCNFNQPLYFCIFDIQTNKYRNMDTVLLEITNEKAYKLIQDLEALDIVKILEKNTKPKESLSKKFAG
jgi:hypothetical protein